MNSAPLLSVRNLQTRYVLSRSRVVHALNGVTLDVQPGETLGVIGESGCGKSTLARTVLRLVPAASGSVSLGEVDLLSLKGRALRRARRRMQVVFQDPMSSLNPRIRVGASVREPLDIHRSDLDTGQRRELATRILRRVGLSSDQERRFPHQLSGGQRQRVGIARALVLTPELLIADEPVSSLDISIQVQIIGLLDSLRRELGLAMIFISHDIRVVRFLSDRIAVMYMGRIVESATTDELFNRPLHPYSRELFSAVPSLDPKARSRGDDRKSEVPSLLSLPKGCAFASRCPEASQTCLENSPALSEVSPGHRVACWRTAG